MSVFCASLSRLVSAILSRLSQSRQCRLCLRLSLSLSVPLSVSLHLLVSVRLYSGRPKTEVCIRLSANTEADLEGGGEPAPPPLGGRGVEGKGEKNGRGREREGPAPLSQNLLVKFNALARCVFHVHVMMFTIICFDSGFYRNAKNYLRLRPIICDSEI